MESMQNIFITVSHGKFRETMCDTKAVGVPCCQETYLSLRRETVNILINISKIHRSRLLKAKICIYRCY